MVSIQAGKHYRNIKTQNIYVVLHVAKAAWDNSQVLIVYRQLLSDEHIWIRSRTEFYEKFEEVDAS